MTIKPTVAALCDVLVMNPGSTVEYAFLVLKNMGVIGGDFVRVEGAGRVSERYKLVKKDDCIGRQNRMLRMMTNNRR